MKQAESRAQLRWLIRRDMDRVMEIEWSSFQLGDQWDEAEFITALRNRNCIGTVLDPVTIEDDISVDTSPNGGGIVEACCLGIQHSLRQRLRSVV